MTQAYKGEHTHLALYKGIILKVGVYLSLLISLPVFSNVPEYVSDDAPEIKSIKERDGLLNNLFGEERKKLLNDQFWHDSSLTVKPRLYFFDRTGNTITGGRATAIGGAIDYSSGWWKKRLRFSASGYTSQKVYADKGIDSTLLLQSNQDAINTLALMYVDVNISEKISMRAGRLAINLPFINKRDSRMVPITHEGVGIGGNINDNFKFAGGHITKMKRRNSESFISMSEASGALDTNEPLTLVGLRYGKKGSWNVSAINQYTWNTMNTLYGEASFNQWLVRNAEVGLSIQYIKQQSVGGNLIGEFDIQSYGARFSTSYKHAIFNLAYTSTEGGSEVKNPYGGSPSYISLMIKDFTRAGENAWLLGTSYDFKHSGIPGLSAFINYARGRSDLVETRSEFDVTVDFEFQSKLLNGLWLRCRWGKLDQQGGTQNDITDARIILNYKWNIF